MYNLINKTVNDPSPVELAIYVAMEGSNFIDFWEEFEKKNENVWKIHDFINYFWKLESLDPLEAAVLNTLSPDTFKADEPYGGYASQAEFREKLIEVAFKPYKHKGYKQENVSNNYELDENEVYLYEQSFIQLCVSAELAYANGETENYQLFKAMARKVADIIGNHNGVNNNYYRSWLQSRELLSGYYINEKENENNSPTLVDNTTQQKYLDPVHNQLDESFKNGLKKEIFDRINSDEVQGHIGNSYVEYYTKKYGYDRDVMTIKDALHRKRIVEIQEVLDKFLIAQKSLNEQIEQEGMTEKVWDQFVDLSSQFNALIKQLEHLNNQHYVKNNLAEILEHQFELYKSMLDNYKSALERRHSSVANGASPYYVDIDYYTECFANYHNLVKKYGNIKTKINCIYSKNCLNDLEVVSDDDDAELLVIQFHQIDQLMPLLSNSSGEDRKKREELIQKNLFDIENYKNSADQYRRELTKYREAMLKRKQEILKDRNSIIDKIKECHNSFKNSKIQKRLNFIKNELNKDLDPNIDRDELINEYNFLVRFCHKDLPELQGKLEKYNRKINKIDNRIKSVSNEIGSVLKKVEFFDRKIKALDQELEILEDAEYSSKAKKDQKWLANRLQNYAENGYGPKCRITIKDLEEFSGNYRSLNRFGKFVRGLKNIFSCDPEAIVSGFLNKIRGRRANKNRKLSGVEMEKLRNSLPKNIGRKRNSSNRIISSTKSSPMKKYGLKELDQTKSYFSHNKSNKKNTIGKDRRFAGVTHSYKSRLSKHKPEQQESMPSLKLRING